MLTINRTLGLTLVICSMLCLCACPYESDFPLSKCGEATIDKQLIGQWKLEAKEGEQAGVIMIHRFNDHEYLITAKGENESTAMLMRAFGTIIDGQTFLNVQEISKPGEKKRAWNFVNYSVSEDKLMYKVVEEDLFKKKSFTSPEALYTFIKENLNKKELYDQDDQETLHRIIPQPDPPGAESKSP